MNCGRGIFSASVYFSLCFFFILHSTVDRCWSHTQPSLYFVFSMTIDYWSIAFARPNTRGRLIRIPFTHNRKLLWYFIYTHNCIIQTVLTTCQVRSRDANLRVKHKTKSAYVSRDKHLQNASLMAIEIFHRGYDVAASAVTRPDDEKCSVIFMEIDENETIDYSTSSF